MRPVLFRLRGRPIPSYPAMLFLGIMAGLVVGDVVGNASGLEGGRVYLASVLLLLPALVGARLASVAANWSHYRDEPRRIWRRAEGGQAMYGGLLAVPVSIPLLALFRLPFWGYWDVTTFSVLTGMIFARVGCLLTGCCAGRLTVGRFGLVLANGRGEWARRVPTQLLEAGLGAILLVVAGVFAAAHAPAGTIFSASVAAYALGRLFLEPLRERQRRVAGLRALRVASLVLLAIAVSSIVPRVI